jgi:hypothetical protein
VANKGHSASSPATAVQPAHADPVAMGAAARGVEAMGGGGGRRPWRGSRPPSSPWPPRQGVGRSSHACKGAEGAAEGEATTGGRGAALTGRGWSVAATDETAPRWAASLAIDEMMEAT